MNNSIINIKEYFNRHNGLQLSNRYSLSFSGLPETLQTFPSNDLHPMAVTMGARAIDSLADNLAGYGNGRSVPRSQKFIPGVMLSFAVTNDNFITDFFNSWFNLIYSGGRIKGDYSTPFQLNYYDSTVRPVQLNVNLLNPNGDINRIYTFYEVFPLENMPIELNMLEPNKFMLYQVLLNYREFTIKAP